MDARLQRAPSDGMGRIRATGRERCDQESAPPARVDAGKHSGNEEDPSPLRLQLRLGPRSLYLRARILSLESVVFPEDAGARPGVSQEGAAELVSEVCHGAGQRTGGRWLLLAA